MFNNEQLKIIKECLDYKYGNNLVDIQKFDHSNLPMLKATVEDARKENETINQIKSILRQNFNL